MRHSEHHLRANLKYWGRITMEDTSFRFKHGITGRIHRNEIISQKWWIEASCSCLRICWDFGIQSLPFVCLQTSIWCSLLNSPKSPSAPLSESLRSLCGNWLSSLLPDTMSQRHGWGLKVSDFLTLKVKPCAMNQYPVSLTRLSWHFD